MRESPASPASPDHPASPDDLASPDRLASRDTSGSPGHRALYLRGLDPEGPLPLGADLPAELRAGLPVPDAAALAPVAPGDLPRLVADARASRDRESGLFRDVLAGEGGTGAAVVRCLLLNCAPLALSAGAWLQWLSSSGNAEDELALRVLSLYASDIGVGYPHADRGSDFRALLRRHRIGEPTAGVRLAADEEIENAGFRLPGLLIAMSRLPDRFRPELLGADLCLRAVGTLPPLHALGRAAPHVLTADDLRTLDLGAPRPGEEASGLDRSRAAAEWFLQQAGPEEAARFHRGLRWASEELRLWCAAVAREAALARHPDYGVWRMICTRARQAVVYHARFKLEGRPLSAWFADLDAGPGPFLGALARSPLVRPGRPDASPLLRSLIGPKGPMFRIFTEHELAVLRRWIAALPEPGSVLHRTGPADDDPGRTALHRAQRGWYRHTSPDTDTPTADTDAPAPDTDDAAAVAEGQPGRPRTARDAYRMLLARADSAALRGYARDYARRWLARSRYGLERAPGMLPPRWDREQGLRRWLDEQHDRHSQEFADREEKLPSREALIDDTLQLAPLIMIDGGWLQGFTDYRHASSPSGQFLFRTYWDELGNGDRTLNHPLIYRGLLRTMGIDLPPTDSPAFAHWPGFRDRSFALPVYWLSVARFPRTYQPEILGLNLAMELSGVGGSYRSARLALKHYGYSTQFVDLHNTIDNVATGHSAWAVDAIDSYLADLPGVLGHAQEAAVWDRIRAGYRSLSPPEGPVASLYAAFTASTAKP